MNMNNINKPLIFDAVLATWGYDHQVIETAGVCNALAASCVQFVNHKSTGNRIAEEAAGVEIMIEQLRHNGMNDMIEQHKTRKLTRLSLRVGIECTLISPDTPTVSSLLEEALEQLNLAQELYLDPMTSNRLAAARTRSCIAALMQASQTMIRLQQQLEYGPLNKERTHP
ncbi:TPA: hypothetical protein ACH1TP_002920 [Enterobacter roggenkampii]|uniref:hypothetical protein n=1 Tax=Enterobacteriaceae TaxID=543 RepID=UPI001EEFCBA7|nr:hypothetical protein [Lelliottia sp. RWM.1]